MAMSASTNKASVVMNTVDPPPPKRTYVAFGLERGGTSAVAGVMRALGLYLGEIEEGNNEDKSFHARPLGQMRATIARRNETHDVWGWKHPPAVSYLPALVRSIRNPYFIIVFRDMVATTLSRHQWDGQFLRRSVRMALHEANVTSNANASFALATGRPCLLVSNEKLDRYPVDLVDEMADFLHVLRPEGEHRQRILEYIQPGSYKSFDEFFPPGSQVKFGGRAEEDASQSMPVAAPAGIGP